ncbi:uncharacterized protein BKA78DRAFT_262653 [Phyllosticta capitalensis]|uniref:uncharacterized protein n=1 Tax=Phyllosticta capitalensis TaxID=121624 RepID=UPI00312E2AA9
MLSFCCLHRDISSSLWSASHVWCHRALSLSNLTLRTWMPFALDPCLASASLLSCFCPFLPQYFLSHSSPSVTDILSNLVFAL